MIEGTTILCRRCQTQYVVAQGTILPSCPQCGRAATPLRERIHHNGLAAVIALVALGVLAVAFSQPFMTMDTLGERRAFSLVGGIRELFARGYAVLGCVLFLFSVCFPIAKLAALLLATTTLAPLPLKARRVLHKIADLTGKYSMLDVLVVAVIIVLVKFRSMAHVEAHAGTVWFCSAVLLSMLSGICVKLPAQEKE